MYLGMALRVLLADESSTIKKAIQMVLSDYGVEVKMVPTGIDVLSVTLSYQPDIILIDVLLTKKNGYEVCLDLKSNDQTSSIPVVLMWSSFMQIDQTSYRDCKANATLEKPFDTETVRGLVESLVPKLQTFPLKGLLNHAGLPDFEESDTFIRQKNDFGTLNQKPVLARANTPTEKKPEAFSMEPKVSESVENPSSFVLDEDDATEIISTPTHSVAPVITPTARTLKEAPKPAEVDEDEFSPLDLNKKQPESDDWSASKPSQFVIETESFGDFEEVKVINSDNDPEKPNLRSKINEQIQSYLQDAPVASHKAQSLQNKQGGPSSFDEQLMREEIRQITERICWQIIPEITEKLVREELNKLLQGIENNV
jgi:two-component system, cell cycle response regulator